MVAHGDIIVNLSTDRSTDRLEYIIFDTKLDLFELQFFPWNIFHNFYAMTGLIIIKIVVTTER
jgi:hypothetical protein